MSASRKTAYLLLLLVVAATVTAQYGRNYPMGSWHHDFTYGWGGYILWPSLVILIILVIYLMMQLRDVKRRLDLLEDVPPEKEE